MTYFLRHIGGAVLLASILLLPACSCGGGSAKATDDPQLDTPDQQQDQPAEDQPAEEQPEQPAEPEPEPGPDEPDPEPVDPTPEPVDPEPEPAAPRGDDPVELGAIAPGFAGSYSQPAIKLPAAFSDPLLELPIDLAGVSLLDPEELSARQREVLSQSGFVVMPAEYKEFYHIYSRIEGRDQAVFVTVDSVLHVYHLLFDKLLRDLEDEQFYATIEQLTAALEDSAEEQYKQAEKTSLEDAARRVWAYFAIAEQLIMDKPPAVAGPIADLVAAELALIEAHDAFGPSPLLSITENYTEDYTQYIPRGHYTRTEQRERYFRTLMWYGRMNLRLKVPAETRLALLITRLCHLTGSGDSAATSLWASVYDPTAFLVGRADDLGIHEYTAVAREVYGDSLTLADLADDELLGQFCEQAKQLPPPQVNSMFVAPGEDMVKVTHGFRFMGQRFVLDAYIFQQLLHDKVLDRYMPNGLDVLAAFGNDEALGILDELGETAYANYDSQMAKVRGEVAQLTEADWTPNVYFSWLYTLDGVIADKGEEYPPFMRTAAWTRKDLHTALGSWAELKHDTILYAKQAYPMAGAAPPGEVVWNWVEPNPLAFARLRALAQLTREGLSLRGLLSSQLDSLLGSLIEHLVSFQSIAERELAGEAITEDENWQLKGYEWWLEHMVEESGDFQGEPDPHRIIEPGDEPAAIIADVASDFTFSQVREVGTGRIFELCVVVPDGYGGLQAARGGVYSYYEFTWAMDDRLTDEKWRGMIDTGEIPERPSWTAEFIAE